MTLAFRSTWLVCALAFILAACGGQDSGSAGAQGTKLLAASTTSSGLVRQELSGEVNVAVVILTSNEVPLISAVTPAYMREVFFDPAKSVASMLADMSYGRVKLNGKIIGPLTIPNVATHGEAFDAGLRAAAQVEDLTKYQHIIFMGPLDLLKPAARGEGSLGKVDILLPDGRNMQAGVVFLTEVDAASREGTISTALHELGHNFTLHHANLSMFGQEPLGPAGLIPDGSPVSIEQSITNAQNTSKRSKKSLEYGDSYANMGLGALEPWNAPHRAMLGWLREGEALTTVQASGSFTLVPITKAGAGTKALRVRRGSDANAWLWLEFRKGDMTDGAPLYRDSVLVHYEDENWIARDGHTHTVHMHPGVTNTASNSGMLPGESWKDPYSNLRIRLAAGGGEVQQVEVTYEDAPKTTLAPARALAQAGGSTLTVDVNAAAGAAWRATSNADWVRIVSGASGSGAGKLTLQVMPSTSIYTRGATVTVGDATLALAQAGVEGAVSLSTTTVQVPAEGGVARLGITATAVDYHFGIGKCSVDETNTLPANKWISNFSFPTSDLIGAFGSGTLEFVLAPNQSNQARSATFPVDGRTVTIVQAAGPAVGAGIVWERIAQPDAPASREGMAMAAQESRGEFMMFGGYPPGFMTAPLDETWVWTGTTWLRRNPAHKPAGLQGHAMAYDPLRDKIILFGGASTAKPWGSSETWEWDGQDWTKLNPATTPPGRLNHAMAFNRASGKIVMFGGQMDINGELADTWEWDGRDWKKLSPASAPSKRMRASMAYDPVNQEVILFGGVKDTTVIPPGYIGTTPSTFETYGDTWSWNGERWLLRASSGPQPRSGASMASLLDEKKIVLIGGMGWNSVANAMSHAFEETWTWNGVTWTLLLPERNPEYSDTYGFGYDPVSKTVFAFLGDELHCKERGAHMYALRKQSGPANTAVAPNVFTLPLESARLAIPFHGPERAR